MGPESARWDRGQGGQGPWRTGKGTVPAELGARVTGSEFPLEGWALAAEQAVRRQEVKPGDLGICHRDHHPRCHSAFCTCSFMHL